MSKSKKKPFEKEKDKSELKFSNKKIRKYKGDIPNGNFFKKLYKKNRIFLYKTSWFNVIAEDGFNSWEEKARRK